MQPSEVGYAVETNKSFDEAVEAVHSASQAKGFRVLTVHDVQALLTEKGFQQGPLKIVEV